MLAARPCRVFAVARATLCSVLFALPALRTAAQALPTQAEVNAGISKVANYWLTTDPWKPGVPVVQWTGATLMNGFLEAYNATGNPAYLDYVTNWGIQRRYVLNAADTTTTPDNIACGEVYIKLYKMGGSTDSAIIQHIKSNIDYQTSLGASGFSTFGYVDTLNMGMPSFAGISVIENRPAVAEQMYQLFIHAKTAQNSGLTLWNPTDRLWYRDTTQKSPKTYWSRGNGWAFLALAKVLQTLPSSDPHYAEYLANFQQEAAALPAVQRADGLWRVDLANATTYPGPEATGTSCFLYGLAYGVRAGILDSVTYSPVIAKAWNGLMTVCVHPDSGMIGYLQDTGSKPSDRQPLDYNNTNGNGTTGTSTRSGDFGYGLFLLGAAELSKLVGSGSSTTVGAPLFSPPGGTYSAAQSVAITSPTAGATIRYTTNGTTPSTTVGTVYAGPIAINATTTVKAIASKTGLTTSAVATAVYTISTGSGNGTLVLEAENLARTVTSGTITPVSSTTASGGAYLVFRSVGGGDSVEFTTSLIPAGTYTLRYRFLADPNRARHNFTVDGIAVGGIIDEAAPAGFLTVNLGSVSFASAGTHTIRLTISGRTSRTRIIAPDAFTFVAQ